MEPSPESAVVEAPERDALPAAGPRLAVAPPLADASALSPCERRLLALLADGLTCPEVAARLHVSRHTVNTHLRNAKLKLGKRTQAGVVAAAIRRQLV